MVRIGTSGWSYPHWQRRFYPAGLPAGARLGYYAGSFDTVEVNSTFYGPPRPALLHRWVAATPPGFLFAVKANRRFTHETRLRPDPAEFSGFFMTVAELGDKLGPVLFQTPASLPCDLALLADFLGHVPHGFRAAFELRHPSWWTPEVYALLAERRAACVAFDLDRRQSPPEVTADFAYVRLHGPGRPYHDRYPAETLEAWARRIEGWREAGKDVFLYFDNTEQAAAALDAEALKARLGVA